MNVSGNPHPPLTEEQQLTLTIIYVITITIALLGNAFVIRIMTTNRRLKTTTNIMIIQLAIADLMVTFFVMPMVVSSFFGGFPFWFGGTVGTATCKMIHFLSHITIASSIITLVLMAVERFFAVVQPMRRVSYFRSKKAVTFTIWGMSISIMSPILVAGNTTEIAEHRYVCTEKLQAFGDPVYVERVFYISMFVLLYAVPLLLVAVLYSVISYKLWFRRLPGSVVSRNKKLADTEKRCIVRMLISIVIVFALCWLPAHINHYILSYPEKQFSANLPTWLVYVNFWVSHANSAFNPCLYITLNKKFRRAFMDLFRREHFSSAFFSITLRNYSSTQSSRRSSNRAPYTTTRHQARRTSIFVLHAD